MDKGRHELNDLDKEIMESCKVQLQIHVSHLLQRGVRSANIEIDLIHYIKGLLKED
jgi:hypothetical protein